MSPTSDTFGPTALLYSAMRHSFPVKLQLLLTLERGNVTLVAVTLANVICFATLLSLVMVTSVNYNI